MAKVTGEAASAHYRRVDADGVFQLPPEFNHMSLKPGIGRRWYDKYKDQTYAGDYLVVNGQKMRPPRYYDKLYAATSDVFEEVALLRDRAARAAFADNSDDRLRVKEICTTARLGHLKREM